MPKEIKYGNIIYGIILFIIIIYGVSCSHPQETSETDIPLLTGNDAHKFIDDL